MPLALLLLLGDLLDLLGVYSSFLPLTTSLSLAMAVPQCFSSRPRLDKTGEKEIREKENREQDSRRIGMRRTESKIAGAGEQSWRTELENREQESGRTEHKRTRRIRKQGEQEEEGQGEQGDQESSEHVAEY